MSALLEIVAEARELREAAQAAFLTAIRNAAKERDWRGRQVHTGTEIARAAGVSKQRISQILRGDEER